MKNQNHKEEFAEDILVLSRKNIEIIFILQTMPEKMQYKTRPKSGYECVVCSDITDLQAKLVSNNAPVVVITDEETHPMATKRLIGSQHIIITISNMQIEKAAKILKNLLILEKKTPTKK